MACLFITSTYQHIPVFCFRQCRRNNQCGKYKSKSNFPNWASYGNNFIAVYQEIIVLNREVKIKFSLVFPMQIDC